CHAVPATLAEPSDDDREASAVVHNLFVSRLRGERHMMLIIVITPRPPSRSPRAGVKRVVCSALLKTIHLLRVGPNENSAPELENYRGVSASSMTLTAQTKTLGSSGVTAVRGSAGGERLETIRATRPVEGSGRSGGRLSVATPASTASPCRNVVDGDSSGHAH